MSPLSYNELYCSYSVETSGCCDYYYYFFFFTLALAYFLSWELYIHLSKKEEKILPPSAAHQGEQKPSTHLEASPLSLGVLGRKSVTPVQKGRFSYLGFGPLSGNQWRHWSFLSIMIWSVGSYRLCENSLGMSSFPLGWEVTGWSSQWNNRPEDHEAALTLKFISAYFCQE